MRIWCGCEKDEGEGEERGRRKENLTIKVRNKLDATFECLSKVV